MFKTKLIPFYLILIFLTLALLNINYPGISIDEAADGIVSKYILMNKSNIPKSGLMMAKYYIILFGKILPIYQPDYYGNVLSYLISPFLRIFGSNVFSLRLSSILILAIFIPIFYHFCRIWFNVRIALLSGLLLVTNLVFVQFGRVGLYRGEIFVMAFFCISLYFLAKYSQSRNNLFLYLSCFFLGLDLSLKITALYYIVAIIVAYSLIGRQLDLLGKYSFKKTLLATFSFCTGSIFIILYNIKNPLITPKLLVNSLFYPTTLGNTNNLDYFNNLKTRTTELVTILRGEILERFDWGVAKACYIERISSIIFGLTLISLIFVLILTLFLRNKAKIIKYRILFLYIIFIVVFLLTPFTLSSFYYGHLLVLLPFPLIVTALFLDYIWKYTRQKKLVVIIIYTSFLFPIFLFNIWMNLFFNIEMKKNGGYGRWSTAIYELVDYLQENKIYAPITFGWGLQENIAFLSNQEVIPLIYDVYGKFSPEYYDFPETIINEYNQLSLRNNPLFYLTMKSDENISHRDLFLKLALEDGKEIKLEKLFLNRAGHPVYWLYKIY